jgi:hypothetical protein
MFCNELDAFHGSHDRKVHRAFSRILLQLQGQGAIGHNTRTNTDALVIEMTTGDRGLVYKLQLFDLAGNALQRQALEDPIDRHHAELQAMIAEREAAAKAQAQADADRALAEAKVARAAQILQVQRANAQMAEHLQQPPKGLEMLI